MTWRVVYTRPNEEFKVRDRLELETFLPYVVEKVRTNQKNRFRFQERALYPRYLFANSPDNQLHEIVNTVGVSDLVRMDGEPVIVPDHELERIRRTALPTGEVLQGKRRKARYRPGDRVKIVEENNPFFGFNCLITTASCGIISALIEESGIKATIPVHSVERQS